METYTNKTIVKMHANESSSNRSVLKKACLNNAKNNLLDVGTVTFSLVKAHLKGSKALASEAHQNEP